MKRSTSALVGLAVLEPLIIGGTIWLLVELKGARTDDPQAAVDALMIVGMIGGGFAGLVGVILMLAFLHHRRAEKRWGDEGLPLPAPLPEVATCILRLTRSLKRAGLRGGPVTGEWSGAALALTGAQEGHLRIDSAMVQRIRCGYIEGKYGRFYETRVWLMGERKPIKLEPQKPDEIPYGTVMRLFARKVAVQRGVTAVERGTTAMWAHITLFLLLIPVIAYTVLALTISERRDWLGWTAGTIFFWLFGLVAFLLYRRQRPCAVGDVEELEVFLPPPIRIAG